MRSASREAAGDAHASASDMFATPAAAPPPPPKKSRRVRKNTDEDEAVKKRRCISSACVPCRKRKSKCDGTTPACSACAAVYNTECIYDPNSDHRRKGVYKKDLDSLKTRNSTLQTLIQAILNAPEDDVAALVQQIRTCESLDAVAEAVVAKENGDADDDDDNDNISNNNSSNNNNNNNNNDDDDNNEPASPLTTPTGSPVKPTFENQLSSKMGELRLEDGSTRYIGGTSHLIYLGQNKETVASPDPYTEAQYQQVEDPYCTWTTVTSDAELVQHLISMYFCWHYTFFTTLSKNLFLHEFQAGKPPPGSGRKMQYCTPLLVNAMLALGCHFTSLPAARAQRDDSATAGDHFFREAKRLIMEGDLHEVPALPTVQALALMSVREAGCGREAKGWVYSGMSFRMACDLGLNLGMHSTDAIDETEEDARRITFWGCFLFDKCWSNYLGRMPQLANNIVTVPKFDVFPVEDAETWSAYTDSGISQAHSQPSRTRAVALHISKLCQISSDLINFFYNPIDIDKAKGKQAELKKLSEIHVRLETWRRELPKELEPKEGGLPHMLVMHMLFQLLYIHLFRPFLKYNPDNSPLPPNVSPRKQCTQAAAMISKLLRLYKRSHGLRQICNICVYITHSACTIHLLNLPEKNAKRDIIHGVKHLEEIAEGWLGARRTLGILSVLAKRWKVDLPEEASAVLARTDEKFGPWNEISTPKVTRAEPAMVTEERLPTSPTQKFSPSRQATATYSMNMADVATANYPARIPAATSNAAAAFVSHSQATGSYVPTVAFVRDPSSLPPTDLTYTRLQRHPSDPLNHMTPSHTHTPATPASTHAQQSLDGMSSAGASPSQVFGGVDQLIREGQDWIFRDQTQLASGFDNWSNQEFGDIASWFAASGAAASGASPAFAQTMNGGPVGAPNGFNVNGVPLNGGAGGVGTGGVGGMQGFTYDEQSWYDYQ